MTLYEINETLARMIEGAIDPETGEILIDDSEIEALKMERAEKLENIALFIKNQDALAEALRSEEKTLAARRKACEHKAERLKEYLKRFGEAFETPRAKVSFRKTKAVDVLPGFIEWAEASRPDLLRHKAPEPDKAAITAALKSGEEMPAQIVERVSVSIK